MSAPEEARPGSPSTAAVRLQPLTRARVAGLGEPGQVWLDALPATLDALAAQWDLTLGRALPGGSSAYVVRAGRADGTEAVLKVSLPDPALADQAATLQRAGGRGYARLLAVDPARHALLLEALGPSLAASSRTPEDQLRILADTLAEAWLPPRPGAPVLDKAAQLGALVAREWEALDRPVEARVVRQALDYAECRSADPGEPVVVHGDAHPGNLLARPGLGTGWAFVDPDGFVTDRAYDLGVALRDWCGRLSGLPGPEARRTLEGWCTLLADRSGVDATRIWEWGYLERVSTGLFVAAFGATRAAAPFLRTAELLG